MKKFLSACFGTGLIVGLAGFAHANSLLETQLWMACPDAQNLTIKAGTMSFHVSAKKSKVTGDCLREALKKIDRYPVNTKGVKRAKSARVTADGVIVLK